jgi:hypothetical protein
MAEHRWMKRREPGLTLSATGGRRDIHLLDFLDDRWVISIPVNGPLSIWDTRESPPKLCELASYSFQRQAFSAAVAVDPHQGDIIIGLRE